MIITASAIRQSFANDHVIFTEPLPGKDYRILVYYKANCMPPDVFAKIPLKIKFIARYSTESD
jgi:hypothetical protein